MECGDDAMRVKMSARLTPSFGTKTKDCDGGSNAKPGVWCPAGIFAAVAAVHRTGPAVTAMASYGRSAAYGVNLRI